MSNRRNFLLIAGGALFLAGVLLMCGCRSNDQAAPSGYEVDTNTNDTSNYIGQPQ